MAATRPTHELCDRFALLESAGSGTTPLRVDEEAGVIFGVRVLGRFSPNCPPGVQGVTAGTEYLPGCMDSALSLYEGMTVRTDHLVSTPATGGRQPATRRISETLGQLRGLRRDGGDSQGACVRGDLHYLKSHPQSAAVVEDVKRGLGVFGLSHVAAWGRAEVKGGRLVVESLSAVRSVDLVDRPATNRNLWESESPPVDKTPLTLRTLLESRRKDLSKARRAWVTWLLEGDGDPGDAVVDAAAAGDTPADPNAAMREAFRTSALAVLDAVFEGSTDLNEAIKKIKDLLTTHAKLTTSAEPDKPATAEGSSETPKSGTEGGGESKESLQAKLDRANAELDCRTLCESHNVKATPTLIKALVPMDAAERRVLLAESRGSNTGGDGGGKPPRSGAPGGGQGGGAKPAAAKDAKSFAAIVGRG